MSSGVTISVEILQSWTTGYGAQFVIKNTNNFAIVDWTISCKFDNSFTWIAGITRSLSNGILILTPADWLKNIAANSELDIGFGGNGSDYPTNPVFNQISPAPQDIVVNSNTTKGTFGNRVFAPYVDTLAWPIIDLASIAMNTGHKFYTLAFIVSDGTGNPSWGGVIPLSQQYFYDKILSIRSQGGDVVISCGGQNGQELAQVVTDINKLTAAYQSIINMYQLAWIDFDIEGASVADSASIDRRNKALVQLKQNNPNLIISFTLPVLPTGLDQNGLNVIKNAQSNGLDLNVVNVMSMDFGESFATNTMGNSIIKCAQNTYYQMQSIGYTGTKIGNTPMLGVNDQSDLIVYPADFQQVVSFSQSVPWMRMLAFWSVNRDNFSQGVLHWASSTSSGVQQTLYQFTQIGHQFS